MFRGNKISSSSAAGTAPFVVFSNCEGHQRRNKAGCRDSAALLFAGNPQQARLPGLRRTPQGRQARLAPAKCWGPQRHIKNHDFCGRELAETAASEVGTSRETPPGPFPAFLGCRGDKKKAFTSAETIQHAPQDRRTSNPKPKP